MSSTWSLNRMISVRLKGKPFNITVIQVYAPTNNAEEAEVERFYEDLQDLLELTPKKDVLFITGDWNAKVESRDTWSNRKIWPWSTKRSRSKANRVLPRECTGHSKHPLPTTQEKTLYMGITRWSILKSDWLYSLQPKMKKLYIELPYDLSIPLWGIYPDKTIIWEDTCTPKSFQHYLQ